MANASDFSIFLIVHCGINVSLYSSNAKQMHRLSFSSFFPPPNAAQFSLQIVHSLFKKIQFLGSNRMRRFSDLWKPISRFVYKFMPSKASKVMLYSNANHFADLTLTNQEDTQCCFLLLHKMRFKMFNFTRKKTRNILFPTYFAHFQKGRLSNVSYTIHRTQ